MCVTSVVSSALTLATRRHSRSTSALSSADCYSGDPGALSRGQIQSFCLGFFYVFYHPALFSFKFFLFLVVFDRRLSCVSALIHLFAHCSVFGRVEASAQTSCEPSPRNLVKTGLRRSSLLRIRPHPDLKPTFYRKAEATSVFVLRPNCTLASARRHRPPRCRSTHLPSVSDPRPAVAPGSDLRFGQRHADPQHRHGGGGGRGRRPGKSRDVGKLSGNERIPSTGKCRSLVAETSNVAVKFVHFSS